MNNSVPEPDFGDTNFELQGLPQSGHDADLRARIPLEVLASQFVDELRRGENPSAETYARRYPLHAASIRESFVVLEFLEHARLQNEATAMRRSMPHRFPFTQLGGCELLREVGRGGMGVVFEARELRSQRTVAVKVLPWRVSMVPTWRERFEQEAKTSARLSHPNIVPVYRFGQEHGYCYYTMQFVNGVSLDAVIDRLRQEPGIAWLQDIVQHQESDDSTGDQSPSENSSLRLSRNSWKGFVRIAMQATQALRYAHHEGLLHNDIKPANILLDGRGRVRVSDFGLSRPAESSAARDACHSPDGTLRYIAPERFDGPHDVRSDLYSFGLTLYELVTQTVACEAANPDELRKKLQAHSIVRPSSLHRDMPRDLETIVLNCIAPDPDDRYSTASALLGDLLRFSQGQRVRSTRSGNLGRLIRHWNRKSPESGRERNSSQG